MTLRSNSLLSCWDSQTTSRRGGTWWGMIGLMDVGISLISTVLLPSFGSSDCSVGCWIESERIDFEYVSLFVTLAVAGLPLIGTEVEDLECFAAGDGTWEAEKKFKRFVCFEIVVVVVVFKRFRSGSAASGLDDVGEGWILFSDILKLYDLRRLSNSCVICWFPRYNRLLLMQFTRGFLSPTLPRPQWESFCSQWFDQKFFIRQQSKFKWKAEPKKVTATIDRSTSRKGGGDWMG